MSKAIKCDKCGKCFVSAELNDNDYYCRLSDVAFVSVKSGREYILGTIGSDGAYNLGRIDLCRNCADRFLEFMGKNEFKNFRTKE